MITPFSLLGGFLNFLLKEKNRTVSGLQKNRTVFNMGF